MVVTLGLCCEPLYLRLERWDSLIVTHAGFEVVFSQMALQHMHYSSHTSLNFFTITSLWRNIGEECGKVGALVSSARRRKLNSFVCLSVPYLFASTRHAAFSLQLAAIQHPNIDPNDEAAPVRVKACCDREQPRRELISAYLLD
jgi:hypothetical protein